MVVGPRTIPEDGTADNLSMSVVGLVETSTGAPAPETSLESSSGKLLSLGVNGVEVAIMLSGLERVRGPTSKVLREGVLS